MPARKISDSGLIIIFLGLHIPLALLMSRYSVLATAHALLTFLLGLFWALTDKRGQRTAYIGAYIVGAEVLWRMTRAGVFWEFSKYAIIVIFIVALLQQRKRQKIYRLAPAFFYFVLLLPSLVYTFDFLPFTIARQQAAFNLSGPLALSVSLLFFANVKLTTAQLQQCLLAIAAPALSICVLAIWGIVTADYLLFVNSSSELFSGGFGPNQVASALSLAVLTLFFYLLDAKHTFALRLIAFGIMGICATMSMMTFSRGGPYMAIAGLVLAIPFLLREGSLARRRLIVITGLLLILTVVIIPYLNDFTGGALYRRFQDIETSGRELIVQGEIQAWLENPIAGTGPGLATDYRLAFFRTSRSHTEFTPYVGRAWIDGVAQYSVVIDYGLA